jgi:hypothetical protein
MLAARHMRKHIPGEPTLTLLPLPGAGGITAMNHSYNVAAKDGTLMHLIHAEVLFETLLSPGVMFNAKDYTTSAASRMPTSPAWCRSNPG